MSPDSVQPHQDVPVAAALAQVVDDFGPSVVYSPGRLRASLSDVLGAVGRQHRAEIDAVCVAAEEGVAAELSSGAPMSQHQLEVVSGRGISAEMAAFAVEAWRGAIRGPEHIDRTMRRTPAPRAAAGPTPDVRQTAAAPPVLGGASPSARDGTDLAVKPAPRTVVAQEQPGVQRSPGATPPPDGAGITPRGRSSGWLALAAVVIPIVVTLIWLALHHWSDGAEPTANQTVVGKVSSLPRDPAVITAEQTVWREKAPYSWPDSGCVQDVHPPEGAKAAPCVFVLEPGVSGSVDDWELVRVELSGPGSVDIRDGRQIEYFNKNNGPYAAIVTYVVEGGGHQSTNRWIIDMSCNDAAPCAKL